MNKLTAFAVLLLVITFSINRQQSKSTLKTTEIVQPEISNGFTVNDKEYTLDFKIDNTNIQKPILVIAIKLHNESKYISPFAKREFTGKFYMDLGSYTNLDFEGEIIETPRSIEEHDPHSNVKNATVNWVRKNTTYKQTLNIKSKKDFEVFGRLQFVIEPRCTLEEIPFAITFKNGEIKRIFSPKC